MNRDDWAELKQINDGLLKWVADQKQQQARAQDLEAARRTKLTPQERTAEDRAAAQKQADAVRQSHIKKFDRMGDAVLKRETWTIAKFCWLLVAENPDEDTSWTFFTGRRSKIESEHKKFAGILESCIGTRLRPVNPAAATTDQRFTVQSLVEAAQAKQLGCFEVLADLIKVKDKQRAGAAPCLPAKGTATREKQVTLRRKALAATARSIAKAGAGKESATEITLSIRGVELTERFKQQYPQWAEVSEKTFAADRLACNPPISVATGRPPNKPALK